MKRKRDHISILEIPREVLMVIFSFLEPISHFSSFCGVSVVCKEFRSIVRSPIFWNSNEPDDYVMTLLHEDDQYTNTKANWKNQNQDFVTLIMNVFAECKFSSLMIENNSLLGQLDRRFLNDMLKHLNSSLKAIYIKDGGNDISYSVINSLFSSLLHLKIFCITDWCIPSDEFIEDSIPLPSINFVELKLVENTYRQKFESDLNHFKNFILEVIKIPVKSIYITDRSEFKKELKEFCEPLSSVIQYYEDFSPEEIDDFGLFHHKEEKEEESSVSEDMEYPRTHLNSKSFLNRTNFMKLLKKNVESIQSLHIHYPEDISNYDKNIELTNIISKMRFTRLQYLSLENVEMSSDNLSKLFLTKTRNETSLSEVGKKIICLTLESIHITENVKLCYSFSGLNFVPPNLKILEISNFHPISVITTIPQLLTVFQNLRELNICIFNESNLYKKLISSLRFGKNLEIIKLGISSIFSTLKNDDPIIISKEMSLPNLQNFQFFFESEEICDSVLNDDIMLLNFIVLYPNLNILRIILRNGKYGYMNRKMFPKKKSEDELRRYLRRILYQDKNELIIEEEEKNVIMEILDRSYFGGEWINQGDVGDIRVIVVLLVLKYVHMKMKFC